MLDTFSKFLTSGVGSIIATLVALVSLSGTVMTAVSQWRLMQGSARFLSIDDREKFMAFWLSWLDAQARVSSATELGEARKIVRERLRELGQFAQANGRPGRSLGGTLGAVFLLQRPSTRGVTPWMIRLPFYSLLMIAIAVQIISLVDISHSFSEVKLITYATLTVLSLGMLIVLRMAYTRGRSTATTEANAQ